MFEDVMFAPNGREKHITGNMIIITIKLHNIIICGTRLHINTTNASDRKRMQPCEMNANNLCEQSNVAQVNIKNWIS